MASPRDLSGLLRWWSADVAGQTIESGRVSASPDVVAGSVATRFGQGRVGPEALTVDGRPAWRFGGAASPASLLTPDVPAVSGAPYSWAVVIAPLANYPGQIIAPGPASTVTASSSQIISETTGTFRWIGFAGASLLIPMPTVEHLVVMDHDGGSGVSRLYATGQGSTRGTLQRRSLAGQQHIGRHGSNDRPLFADVRAILLFDHALSDSEIATLEQWRTEGASSAAAVVRTTNVVASAAARASVTTTSVRTSNVTAAARARGTGVAAAVRSVTLTARADASARVTATGAHAVAVTAVAHARASAAAVHVGAVDVRAAAAARASATAARVAVAVVTVAAPTAAAASATFASTRTAPVSAAALGDTRTTVTTSRAVATAATATAAARAVSARLIDVTVAAAASAAARAASARTATLDLTAAASGTATSTSSSSRVAEVVAGVVARALATVGIVVRPLPPDTGDDVRVTTGQPRSRWHLGQPARGVRADEPHSSWSFSNPRT